MTGSLVAVLWFTSEALADAVTRWPHLADGWSDGDHSAYTKSIESILHDLRETGMANLAVFPVHDVDDLVDWCASEGLDATTGEARSRYAAERSRQGLTVAWPPARNDLCWCGSGVKYKRCCRVGPRPA